MTDTAALSTPRDRVPDADAATAVERERAALYLRQRPTLRLGNLALQLVCVMLMWSTGNRVALVAWVVMNVLLMAARDAATRPLATGEIASDPAIRRWFRSLTAWVLVGGLLWGGGAFAFLDVTDPIRLATFLLILMGVSWGAVASMSVHLPAVVAFVAPVCVLTAAKLAATGTSTANMLALLAIAFMLFSLVTARNYAQSIDATLRLAVENLRLLAEVTAAKEAAERASAEKSRFLAALSHDVRQPLYAAGLFLESLGSRLSTAEQRAVYDNTSASLTAVGDLFDAVLEASQLENAPPEPKSETFDLASLAAGLRAEFSAEASRKGLVLRFSTDETLIASDPVLVTRVLRNLISNAIKHTDDGFIELRAVASGDAVQITVADSGVGIHAPDHARIFEEYYQLDNPGRDHRRGLGLGLAVVKRICDLLGTSITLDSEPGRGARFSFSLPRGAVRDLPRPVIDASHDLVGVHVLFVEDDEAVRSGLTLLLNDWECVVSAGANLDAALADARAQPRPIDVVLSDYRLEEGVNGIDVIRAVREQFDPGLPALLLTGETGDGLVAAASAASVPVLRKPVAPETLRDAIGRAIE